MTATRIRWFNALLHRGPGYDLPPQTETDLRAALTTLADRWEQVAGPAPDPSGGLFVDEPTPVEYAQAAQSDTYRRAAADIREVLTTGHIPHGLMTDAELDQYGTKGSAS